MDSIAGSRTASNQLTPLIIGCLLSTWLIWGSTYLTIRFAMKGFEPFFMMATRFLCAGGLLMVWQIARGSAWPTAREWRNACIVGTLMLGFGMGATAYAELTIASGLVVAFIAVMPLLLVLINSLFRIFPTRRELAAVSVGFCGVVMLTRGSGIHSSTIGLIAIICGCAGWASGSILSQRGFPLAAGATGFASEMLCGGIALLGISHLAGESWRWPVTAEPWIAWAYLVVFGSLIAFNAYMYLLANTSTSLASSYTLVNPVVALLLGVTLGAEQVTSWEWMSAGIILIGILLLFLGRRQDRS